VSIVILSGLSEFVPGQSYTSIIGAGYSVVPQSNSDLSQLAVAQLKKADAIEATKSMGAKMSAPASGSMSMTYLYGLGALGLGYLLWRKFK